MKVISAGGTGTEEQQSPLLHLGRLLRDRWWIVVLTTSICVGLAIAHAVTTEDEYEATSKVLFRESPLSNAVFGGDIFGGSIDPQRDSATNQRLVQSREVAAAVRRDLGLSLTPQQLLDKIEVQSDENTDIVNITATDTDPELAAEIANSWAQQYVIHRRESDRAKVQEGERLLRERLAQTPEDATAERQELRSALQRLVALEAVQTGDAEVADRAQVPSSPSSPKPVRDTIVAFIFGVALGMAIIFLLDSIDRRVKSVEDFERLFSLRALVTVPQRSFKARGISTAASALEPYRILRNSLTVASVDRPLRVVLVTSAVLGDGKTSVAANLALASALSGDEVVLIEADLRRPRLTEHFNVTSDVAGGLTSALIDVASPNELLLTPHPDTPNLRLLASGPLPPDPGPLLRSGRFGEILDELASEATLVVIDAPPLLPVADAQILLDRAEIDGCLLVARLFHTRRDAAKRTRATLDRHRVEPLGLVITGARDDRTYGYYYEESGRRRRASIS